MEQSATEPNSTRATTKRNCIPWLLLGFLLLGLLALLSNCVGASNHITMANKAVETANNGLKLGGFDFATAQIDGANIVITGNAADQATKKAACESALAALKLQKMVGLPGVVRTVKCEIKAPGDENLGDGLQAEKPAAPTKTAEIAKDNSKDKSAASINTCTQELIDAQKDVKIGYAKSGVEITAGHAALDKIADIAKNCETFGVIEIGGHTDSGGEAAMNLRLSQQRADKVKQYLVSKGVKADKLIAKGYGETKPLVEDHAVIGVDNPQRAINRRTEFTISAQ